MSDIREIIDKWGGSAAFARDLRIKPGLARQWRLRNSIPGSWWLDVAKAAAVDPKLPNVTLFDLAQIASEARNEIRRP